MLENNVLGRMATDFLNILHDNLVDIFHNWWLSNKAAR